MVPRTPRGRCPVGGAGALRDAYAVLSPWMSVCSAVTPAAVVFTNRNFAESHVLGNSYRINPRSFSASGDPDAGLTPAAGRGSLGLSLTPERVAPGPSGVLAPKSSLRRVSRSLAESRCGACGLTAPSASGFMQEI